MPLLCVLKVSKCIRPLYIRLHMNRVFLYKLQFLEYPRVNIVLSLAEHSISHCVFLNASRYKVFRPLSLIVA